MSRGKILPILEGKSLNPQFNGTEKLICCSDYFSRLLIDFTIIQDLLFLMGIG